MKRLLLNSLETNCYPEKAKLVNVYFFKRMYFELATIVPERRVWNAPQLMDEIFEKAAEIAFNQRVGGKTNVLN